MATYTASSAALLTLDVPLDTWEGSAGRKAAKNRLSQTLSSAELAEHIGKIVAKPQANGRLFNIDFRFPESFEALRATLGAVGTFTPVGDKDLKERLQRKGAIKEEMTKAASNVLLPQQAFEVYTCTQNLRYSCMHPSLAPTLCLHPSSHLWLAPSRSVWRLSSARCAGWVENGQDQRQWQGPAILPTVDALKWDSEGDCLDIVLSGAGALEERPRWIRSRCWECILHICAMQTLGLSRVLSCAHKHCSNADHVKPPIGR